MGVYKLSQLGRLTVPRTNYASILAGNARFYPFPSIANLAAHYDASDLSTISLSGNQVTQWNDKSGNGRHATQGTSTQRPLSGTRTINGLNVLDFDGTDDHLRNDALASLFSGSNSFIFTAFYVRQSDVLNNNNSNWGFGWSQNSNAFHNDVRNGSMQFGTPGGATGFDDPAIFDNLNPGFVTQRGKGSVNSSYTSWLNKTQVRTGSNMLSGTTTFDRSAIGASPGRSNVGGWRNGAIGEMLFYNRELTLSEVSEVQNYLSWKWSI
jgi:hypothetical protein